ncbi:MAG TPA: nuclear transport factor 2 family protein, partial [Pseudomonadales bacterium]|nr:nuclear transport factor 2 family protein [Pseudomonadales bacterium]
QENNKQIVRDYVDAFNRGDLQRLRSLFSEEAEIQGVLGKGLMDKVLPIWQQLIEGYGINLTIESMIAEGNIVAVRYTERGTFTQAAFGNQPTGQSYELVAMEWFEVNGDKISKRWGARDAASQARQLGIPLN